MERAPAVGSMRSRLGRLGSDPMAATVVVFRGEYDLACKDHLRKFLESYIEPNLVLDLSEVSYVDSSFVTELVRFHRRRREKDFDPEVIVLAHPMVQRLFEILDLGSLFQVVGTLDEALANNGKAMSIQYAFREDDIDSGPLQYEDADGTSADATPTDATG